MTELSAPTFEPSVSKSGIAVTGNQTAPFIVWDGVATFGLRDGIVQVEVAAGTIVPTADGGTRTEFIITGHLRCSIEAAIALKTAIDQALLMRKQAPETPTQSGTMLN